MAPPRGHARTDSGASEDGDLYIAIRDHVASADELMFLKGEVVLVTDRESDAKWTVRWLAASESDRPAALGGGLRPCSRSGRWP